MEYANVFKIEFDFSTKSVTSTHFRDVSAERCCLEFSSKGWNDVQVGIKGHSVFHKYLELVREELNCSCYVHLDVVVL